MYFSSLLQAACSSGSMSLKYLTDHITDQTGTGPIQSPPRLQFALAFSRKGNGHMPRNAHMFDVFFTKRCICQRFQTTATSLLESRCCSSDFWPFLSKASNSGTWNTLRGPLDMFTFQILPRKRQLCFLTFEISVHLLHPFTKGIQMDLSWNYQQMAEIFQCMFSAKVIFAGSSLFEIYIQYTYLGARIQTPEEKSLK